MKLNFNLKFNMKIIVIGLIILITLFTTLIVAFLTDLKNINKNLIIGDVVATIDAFYEREGIVHKIDFDQSGGVIELNISDPNQLEHFNNFRVNINIYSSAKTYFRIAVYEQFTLTYTTGDTTTIVAVTKDGYSNFNYNDNEFFDNREKDDFLYYKNKTQRVSKNEPKVIEFIGELPEIDFHPIYESKYTLQIGFVIDAVQHIDGPKYNWGLDSPPWPGNTGW